MEAADEIRACLTQVAGLRQAAAAFMPLASGVAQVKRLQVRRFAAAYADLAVGTAYGNAVRFFLEELYSDTDFIARDGQFHRVAGAMQRLLPTQAVQAAVSLARVHALTEQFDHAMGQAWLDAGPTEGPAPEATTRRYMAAWRVVGNRAGRLAQLRGVLDLGAELQRLARTAGLRTMLKMMRGPAQAARLESLQRFLEDGLRAFAAMQGQRGGVRGFLDIVSDRESTFIETLFDGDLPSCQAALHV